jgi:hypothetical protein
MTGHLTLESKSEVVLRYVADFARGLGCAVAAPADSGAHAIRIALPESSDALLELISHVALSATRAGVDIGEPRCHITFQHDKAPSVVTLALRIDEFNIDAASNGPAATVS